MRRIALTALALLTAAGCGTSTHFTGGSPPNAATPEPTVSPSPTPQSSSSGAGDCPTPSRPPGGRAAIVDYVDFLEANGHQYISGLTGPMPIARQNLGAEVLVVRCSFSRLNGATGLVTPAPRDGDAAFLEPGSAVYAVRGWPTRCRLAAGRPGQWRVFLAYRNDTAVATPEACALHD